MVETICNECQTQNPAANAFCTACGHKLEAVSVRDVGESLQEGYRLVASGKADQALLLASAVLRKSPTESGAYALMAMAQEESGDISEAIRCYEEVVRLRPESKIDAIKLAQLRESLDEPRASAPSSKRGLAMPLSVGAALLAVAVGMAFAWPRGEQPKPSDDARLLVDNSARGFDVQQPVNQTEPTGPVQAAAAHANPTSDPGAATQNNVSTPTARLSARSNRSTLPPAGPGGRLPNAGGSTPPLVVDITPEQLSKIANNSKPAASDPPKEAVKRPGDENVIERRPGHINISESRKGNPTESGVSENTYRVAQDKMKAGDYRAAIRDFQAALAGSDKKALIHQLIGRCYTRLGDKSSAKQHFETALGIYEAAGSKSAADSVRREIGLLG
jgi:Flp pilus assembly protein TadD